MADESERTADGGRLAIVSDDAQYGKLLAYGLRMAGLDAAVVQTEGDPCEAVVKDKPDLLILDMSMAVVDGLTMLHRLQDEGLPILVLSSSEDRAFSVESLVAGAQDVLVKPATFPVILQRVKRLLKAPRPAAARER